VIKQYHDNNIVAINKQRHQHYLENKEEILKKKKENTFECECGSTCRVDHKSTHNKSKKHQLYIQNKN
jgi:hypothetical protein